MKHVVAIIPARGGSKGIPNKNLVDFCGKPLLAWTIRHALQAQGVASVWVTSDSQAILDVAVSHGARPILRPDAISGDKASSESAWIHALDWIERKEKTIDLVLALQATSPLRESKDIEQGLKDFEKNGYDSLFSGAILEDFLIWDRKKDGTLQSLNYNYLERKPRQDHGTQYVENGSFYLFRPEILRASGNRMGGKIGISLMEFWKSFEVDSIEGLEFCAALMKHYRLDRANATPAGERGEHGIVSSSLP